MKQCCIIFNYSSLAGLEFLFPLRYVPVVHHSVCKAWFGIRAAQYFKNWRFNYFCNMSFYPLMGRNVANAVFLVLHFVSFATSNEDKVTNTMAVNRKQIFYNRSCSTEYWWSSCVSNRYIVQPYFTHTHQYVCIFLVFCCGFEGVFLPLSLYKVISLKFYWGCQKWYLKYWHFHTWSVICSVIVSFKKLILVLVCRIFLFMFL